MRTGLSFANHPEVEAALCTPNTVYVKTNCWNFLAERSGQRKADISQTDNANGQITNSGQLYSI